MSNQIQIFVKNLDGQTTIITLEMDAKLIDLKEQIKKRYSNFSDFYLVHKTKALGDDKNDIALKDLDFQNESTVYVLARLKGGSFN